MQAAAAQSKGIDALRKEQPIFSKMSDRLGQIFGLTPRETDTLLALLCGLSSPQVARCLNISEFTVKQHRRNIISHMGESRMEGVMVRIVRLIGTGVV